MENTGGSQNLILATSQAKHTYTHRKWHCHLLSLHQNSGARTKIHTWKLHLFLRMRLHARMRWARCQLIEPQLLKFETSAVRYSAVLTLMMCSTHRWWFDRLCHRWDSNKSRNYDKSRVNLKTTMSKSHVLTQTVMSKNLLTSSLYCSVPYYVMETEGENGHGRPSHCLPPFPGSTLEGNYINNPISPYSRLFPSYTLDSKLKVTFVHKHETRIRWRRLPCCLCRSQLVWELCSYTRFYT